MKISNMLPFFLLSIVLTLGQDCASESNTVEIRDTLLGLTKEISISIRFPQDMSFLRLQQIRPTAWTYSEEAQNVEYTARFDMESPGHDITPKEFCDMFYDNRREVFPSMYSCGDEIYQEILDANGVPAILTEAVCVKERQIKYELCFMHDHGTLSVIICFYNGGSTKSEIYKHRKLVKKIYKTLEVR